MQDNNSNNSTTIQNSYITLHPADQLPSTPAKRKMSTCKTTIQYSYHYFYLINYLIINLCMHLH